MSLITELSGILEAGKTEYENLQVGVFHTVEETAGSRTDSVWKNRLVHGENGAFMKALLHRDEMAGTIQMIYIDPPFFTGANHEAVIHVERPGEGGELLTAKHLAYGDTWRQGIGQYLSMLASRLMLMKDLLSDEGTIWVHLDWHAVHYVRILMDEIFGPDHFVNEIVWTYKSGGASKKHFARKHDTILVYSKTKKYFFQPLKEKSYNRGFKPYHFKGVEEFQDEMGWYTLVNMKDVWHIDMVGRTSSERTGYATQKPEALLERILACCTREGDICADFFCGSGTLAAAAGKMNRRWICCDTGKLAVSVTQRRAAEILEQDPHHGFRVEAEGDTDPGAYGILRAVKTENGVHLQDCTISLDEAVLEKKDFEALYSTAEESPLQLIDGWSVDWNYDGKIHRPQQRMQRKKGILPLEAAYPKEMPPGSLCSIAAYDVLGGRYHTVISL